jgi:hypothetical protein
VVLCTLGTAWISCKFTIDVEQSTKTSGRTLAQATGVAVPRTFMATSLEKDKVSLKD